jgi:hypothetical protein
MKPIWSDNFGTFEWNSCNVNGSLWLSSEEEVHYTGFKPCLILSFLYLSVEVWFVLESMCKWHSKSCSEVLWSSLVAHLGQHKIPKFITQYIQTCQPIWFWRIFPIFGLNIALSTTVRFKAKKYVSTPKIYFFFNWWKWSPESFYSLQNAKLCLLLPYNCTCRRKQIWKKVAFYEF